VQRGIKRLMATTLPVVHVFTNDPPFALDEGGFPKDLVGMTEAVEDKSMDALISAALAPSLDANMTDTDKHSIGPDLTGRWVSHTRASLPLCL